MGYVSVTGSVPFNIPVTGEDLTMTVLSSSNCESDHDRLATKGKGLLPSSETIKPFDMSSRCSVC